METKYCKYCDKDLHIKEFRERLDKRSDSKYLNNKCKSCEKIDAKLYHEQNKNNPIYLEKTRINGRKQSKKNAKQRWLKNKNSDEWKVGLNDWRKNNKERVSEKHALRAKIWHEKNRDEVSDTYCINQLMQHSNITRDDILSQPRLIETKRLTILLKRELKQQKDGK